MLDLVDSLLVILDLCFALMCTPIDELHLHHFVCLYNKFQVELVQYSHSEPI